MQDETGDTGLYLMGHRWMDPTLGRFVNRDPIGFAGGLNMHVYANNSPVGMADWTGLHPLSLKGGTSVPHSHPKDPEVFRDPKTGVSDWETMNAVHKKLLKDQGKPGVPKIHDEPTIDYNCHSWSLTELDLLSDDEAKSWVEPIKPLIQELVDHGKLVQKATPRVGDLVIYQPKGTNVDPAHSGIVRRIDASGTVHVESKLGPGGRYTHQRDQALCVKRILKRWKIPRLILPQNLLRTICRQRKGE